MEKESKIFKPDIGDVNNNKQVYYSFLNEESIENNRSEDPDTFFKRLDRSNSYMFSKKVLIKTKSATYDTKIAGKMGDKIVTIDSKVIPINEIISITEK